MDDTDFQLAVLLGRRAAFNLAASRCTADEAACLKQLRDTRLYRALSETWDEFCGRYLHISKAHADRIIRQLEELGPQYFALSQLVRISPAAYAAMRSAIHDGHLHHQGEQIALIPENAAKVTAAIAHLRRPCKPQTQEDPIAALERRCDGVFSTFCELARTRNLHERLAALLTAFLTRLEKIADEV